MTTDSLTLVDFDGTYYSWRKDKRNSVVTCTSKSTTITSAQAFDKLKTMRFAVLLAALATLAAPAIAMTAPPAHTDACFTEVTTATAGAPAHTYVICS